MTTTPSLFGDDPGARGRAIGPTEEQTRRSVEAAQLAPEHAGSAAVLCDLAWAIDAARADGKFYGVAQAGPPYTDLADRLGLLPSKADRDDVDAALRELVADLGEPG